MNKNEMIVAGVMSGTSADGINVALVGIGGEWDSGSRGGVARGQTVRLLGHAEYPYPAKVRDAVLAAMNATQASVADLARMNSLLGELYADAVFATQRRFRLRADLVGCHGQTLYHQGEPQKFLGRKVATTWQTGEAAVIAERVGVPVVSDFRPADMAAGGQGAPLVPFVDYLLYRDAKIGRAALNIGGIANVTVIPAPAKPQDVFAFDTGPGNMIIDALVERITHGRQRFDRDARLALRGWTSETLLAWFMRDPYLRLPPPKTAGREQFGEAYAERVVAAAKRFRVSKEDLVRTATVFTSLSIAQAMRRFVLPRARVQELVVAGGGAKNPLMMAQLAAGLPEITIVDAEQFGVAAQAKEAFAFAVLAYEAFHGRANNLPAATGARFSVSMGKRVSGRV